MSAEKPASVLTPPLNPEMLTVDPEAPLSLRARLGGILATAVLTVGYTTGLYITEELSDPDVASAYDSNTGDYPWAAASHVPKPPATDNITWGYTNKAVCDEKSASYDCRPTKIGSYFFRDQWGMDLRNCTSYVAWRVATEFGGDSSGLGGAKTWDDGATAKGWIVRPTGQRPEIGDIAQWDTGGGGFGHVGFVEIVHADGSVLIAEFNRGLDGNFGHRDNMRAEHYIDVNGPNPVGFTLKVGAATTPEAPAANPYAVQSVAVAQNTLGGLSIFTANSNGHMGYKDQLYPGDDLRSKPWGAIQASIKSAPEIVTYPNGALSVFSHGTDGKLHHSWQAGPGESWPYDISPWDLSLRGEPSVVFNYTGGVSVFVPDSNGAMREIDQMGPGSSMIHSPIHNLEGNFQGRPATVNVDGALAVFARGADNHLYTKYQLGQNGLWSGWESLGGIKIKGDPRVFVNRLGGLTVMAIGEQGDILGIDQLFKGESMNKPFYSLGRPSDTPLKGAPAILQTTNNEQMVFATGENGGVYHRAQVYASGYRWTGYFALGGALISSPTVVRNNANGATIFGRTNEGLVVSLDQPGYGVSFNTNWSVLAKP